MTFLLEERDEVVRHGGGELSRVEFPGQHEERGRVGTEKPGDRNRIGAHKRTQDWFTGSRMKTVDQNIEISVRT